MTIAAVAGIALIAGGALVRRSASRAANDGAWTLYGCIPQILGAALFTVSALWRLA